MPLTEREQGFNEGLDAASKLLGAKSDAFYAALRAFADGSFEATLISGRAFELRGLANSVYDLRKLSAEEIAERDRVDALDPTRD